MKPKQQRWHIALWRAVDSSIIHVQWPQPQPAQPQMATPQGRLLQWRPRQQPKGAVIALWSNDGPGGAA